MSDERVTDGSPRPNGDPMSDLAAEYVLGTLSADERRNATDLLAHDTVFAAHVADWEARLAPLLDAIPEQRPPEGVLFDIRHAIGDVSHVALPLPDPSPETENVIRFDRAELAMRRWRRTAIAAGMIAASLLAFVLFQDAYRLASPADGTFVAVLETKGRDPAFVAVIDTRTGAVALRRVGAAAEAGKSHQLWALGGGRSSPESLGVVDGSVSRVEEAMSAAARDTLPDTMFAISLEPEGGSPTGQPTGPVVFTGKLVPAPDVAQPGFLRRLMRGW